MVNKWRRIERRFSGSAWLLVAAVLILIPAALRLVHISADTPWWFAPDVGVFVDEGYKSLAARNLTAFDSQRWHPQDDYPTWLSKSPLTQWTYYWAFQALGVRIGTVRLVGVTCFVLFMTLVALCLKGSYPPAVLAAGLVLLGMQHTLFVFSRLALFEIFLIFFLYGGLLVVKRVNPRRFGTSFLIVFLLGVLAVITVKQTALMYWVTALMCMLLLYGLHTGLIYRPLVVSAIVSSALLALATISLMKMDPAAAERLPLIESALLLAQRFDLFPLSDVVQRIAGSSLFLSDPFLILLGLSGSAILLWKGESEDLAKPYPAALLGLIWLGPVIFALFPHNALRFAVVFSPAYILVFMEGIALASERKEGRQQEENRSWLSIFRRVLPGVIIFFLVLMLSTVLPRADISRWEPIPWMNVALALFAAVTIGAFLNRIGWPKAFAFRGAVPALILLALLFLSFNLARVGDLLLHPTWQIQEISDQLREHVPGDGIVGGDWAPLFTLESDHRTLYMNYRFNKAQRIAELKPGYFLWCDIPDSSRYLSKLRERPEVNVEDVVFVSRYNQTRVALYRLSYNQGVGLGKQPQP